MSPLALAWEAWTSVASNPMRTAVNLLGTLIGATVFVATTGLASTLDGQVSEEFDAIQATQLTMRLEGGLEDEIDWTQPARIETLSEIEGVVGAGTLTKPLQKQIDRPFRQAPSTAQFRGVHPDALEVAAPSLVAGAYFNDFHQSSGAAVALLPVTVAEQTGVVTPGEQIQVGSQAIDVIGIFDSVERRRDLSFDILVPESFIDSLDDSNDPRSASSRIEREVLAEIRIGTADAIAPQARLALAPESPFSIVASSPPDPRNFRRRIEGTIEELTLTMSIIAMAMGTVTIANSATASVYARTPEIGLRSAIGAPARLIFAQLLLETTFLGVLGGILGTMLGIASVYAVGVWQGWAPSVDTGSVSLVLALSAASGMLAGMGPAWRAVRIQPVDALRR